MDFYKRLGIVCRAVPEGKVITYGQAALLCGYPKNARQVGYGLKKELAGDVPAYKVVNSQGVLSSALLCSAVPHLLSIRGVSGNSWKKKG